MCLLVTTEIEVNEETELMYHLSSSRFIHVKARIYARRSL